MMPGSVDGSGAPADDQLRPWWDRRAEPAGSTTSMISLVRAHGVPTNGLMNIEFGHEAGTK
jgi:hypothetical protein